MTKPSPAAQAIRQAINAVFARSPVPPTTEEVAAAVLRAAANAVVPEQGREHRGTAFSWGAWAGRQNTRRDFLAIATELEGAQ